MKKNLLFAIAFLAVSFSSFAQHEFKKFRVDVGLGYAMPKGGGGVLFAVEPKYAVIPNKLSAGLRMESAAMAKSVNGQNASVAATMSYLLTGDYHFTQSTARPFAGAGFGLYRMTSATVSTTGAGATKEGKVGGILRAGLDVAHCRFALEYNLLPASTVEVQNWDMSGNVTTSEVDVKNSYIGIKFSAYIGGGKK